MLKGLDEAKSLKSLISKTITSQMYWQKWRKC